MATLEKKATTIYLHNGKYPSMRSDFLTNLLFFSLPNTI